MQKNIFIVFHLFQKLSLKSYYSSTSLPHGFVALEEYCTLAVHSWLYPRSDHISPPPPLPE